MHGKPGLRSPGTQRPHFRIWTPWWRGRPGKKANVGLYLPILIPNPPHAHHFDVVLCSILKVTPPAQHPAQQKLDHWEQPQDSASSAAADIDSGIGSQSSQNPHMI